MIVLERKKKFKLPEREAYKEWLKWVVNEINNHGQHYDTAVELIKIEYSRMLLLRNKLTRKS